MDWWVVAWMAFRQQRNDIIFLQFRYTIQLLFPCYLNWHSVQGIVFSDEMEELLWHESQKEFADTPDAQSSHFTFLTGKWISRCVSLNEMVQWLDDAFRSIESLFLQNPGVYYHMVTTWISQMTAAHRYWMDNKVWQHNPPWNGNPHPRMWPVTETNRRNIWLTP